MSKTLTISVGASAAFAASFYGFLVGAKMVLAWVADRSRFFSSP